MAWAPWVCRIETGLRTSSTKDIKDARQRKRNKPASSLWLKRSYRDQVVSQSATDSRQGIILLIVLLVVASISLGALAYSRSMLSGHQESVLLGESIQSRNAAESAIDAARLFLASSRLEREEAGEHTTIPTRSKRFLFSKAACKVTSAITRWLLPT